MLKKVPYHNQYGARCPYCASFKSTIYKTSAWCDDQRYRYHHCIDCNLKYVSQEGSMPNTGYVIKPRNDGIF